MLRKMVAEKKQALRFSDLGGAWFRNDLITILLRSEMFKNEEEKIIDEVIGMFLAGTQTVRLTTTNLMCYLE